MHAPVSRVACGKHEDIRIVRNNNCYNKLAIPLSFKQIIYAGVYELDATHSIYMRDSCYKFKYPHRFSLSDLYKLEVIRSKNVDRVNYSECWRRKLLGEGVRYWGGNRFKLKDFNNKWFRPWGVSKTFNNPDLERYMVYDVEPYLAGCYVIIFDNILYLYIGSTGNLVERAKYHHNNIRKIIKNIPTTGKILTTQNLEQWNLHGTAVIQFSNILSNPK